MVRQPDSRHNQVQLRASDGPQTSSIGRRLLLHEHRRRIYPSERTERDLKAARHPISISKIISEKAAESVGV